MYRSTKGASKARRDQINAEIRHLRDLLPISDSDKARLSYLHIMSIACMYTRKCVFFSQDLGEQPDFDTSIMGLSEVSELVHTLPGFLLLLTSEGKLLYLSHNVTEHLGHSMVDLVSQSDSVYDIIDPADHFVVKSNLMPVTTSDTERLFRCRFNTSKFVRRQGSGSKLTLVRARCLSLPYHPSSYWIANSVWVCFCSPLELQPSNPGSSRNPLPTPPTEQAFQLTSFQSQHSRDMKIQAAQESVSLYLGYNVESLLSRSWYSMLHPRDLSYASAQHCTLLREGSERQVEMVVQMEAADGSWVWLYMILQLQTGEHPISCQNFVISESEAWSVRQQLNSEQNQFTLLYQEGSVQPFSPLSISEQVFTPSSSGLSAQSFDFSIISGHSSSEEFPSTIPNTGLDLGSCSSFPIGKDFSQPHESQQMWLPESENLSTGSDPSALPFLGDMAEHHQTLVQSTPLSTLGVSKRHSMGEIVCTPPYTPRHIDGSFVFGEGMFNSDPTTTETSALNQIVQVTHSVCLSDIVSTVSAQRCHRPLYEKLPLSPDAPANDDCSLPEIKGPLYVDVPHFMHHGPPECYLTPEASPTEQLCQGFFPQQLEEDREKLEISLLAQYLSSITEGFLKDCIPKTHPTSPSWIKEPFPTKSSPSCEIPPTMYCGQAYSSLAQDHVSLEKPVSHPQQSPPHSSIQHPPPFPQKEAQVGVQHLCSVQSTHCNSITSGRMLESGTPDNEASPESAMDDELAPTLLPSTLPASLKMSPAPACNSVSPGLSCNQSLLEELVSMDPNFEADVSITPALRQQPELYQLPFQESQKHFYQDGTGDHMF